MRILNTLIVSVLMIALVNAHLCLFEPAQRGPKLPSVIYAGDNNCYKISSNCGGVQQGPVVASYQAGSIAQISFQQNYNHWYSPEPGFMDVAISYNGDNGAYTTLATLDDYNAWDMVSQLNFTVNVQLPDQTCNSCVLRVRYVSNNKGEAPNSDFYQCSDISLH